MKAGLKLIPLGNPSLIIIRNGYGFYKLLGLPFILLGAATLGAFVFNLFVGKPFILTKALIAGSLGTIFLILGYWLSLTDSEFTLDIEGKRLIATKIGLFGKQHHQNRLDEFQAIEITKYWNSSKHGPDYLFSISLVSVRPNESQLLGYGIGEQGAQNCATTLAAFLKLPVMNRTKQRIG